MPKDYDDYLDEVKTLSDADLDALEAEYELRRREREAKMARFFDDWDARLKARTDAILTQIEETKVALIAAR